MDNDKLLILRLLSPLYKFVEFIKLNNVPDTDKQLYKLQLIKCTDDDKLLTIRLLSISYKFVAFMKLNNVPDTGKQLNKFELI